MSCNSVIRNITLDDLSVIDEEALDINKEEVDVASGMKISERFLVSPDIFENTKVLVVDDKIVGVGGDMMTEAGCLVWVMATKHLYDYPKAFFITLSKRFKELKETNDYIFSYVYGKNVITQEWLTKMGFTIHDPVKYGLKDEEFRLFDWRKEPCAIQ